MSTLYGVTCPYCKETAYVHVPDTPSVADGEAESMEETPCNVCGKVIVAYTKSSAEWGVRKRAEGGPSPERSALGDPGSPPSEPSPGRRA